ncbi:MAG: hypothetical protein LH473_13935 [Chitinophagales bacterium]|nr:hypothetical protein [Chitinophagales bacterium]
MKTTFTTSTKNFLKALSCSNIGRILAERERERERIIYSAIIFLMMLLPAKNYAQCDALNFENCNLIYNGCFEEGTTPTGHDGIYYGNATHWHNTVSDMPSGYNCAQQCDQFDRADLMDKNYIGTSTFAGCSDDLTSVDIPINFMSDNQVDIRPGGSGYRYAFLLPLEGMDVDLKQLLAKKKYYFSFWSSPSSCIVNEYSGVCIMLVNSATPSVTPFSLGSVQINQNIIDFPG